jgi:cytochrome c oxidase cbb3-type subunit 1
MAERSQSAALRAAPPRAVLPYDEDIIRLFTIATLFWGIAAFTMGTFIALQLAYPALNLGLEWTTFGRLRPVHTSAAIFAFGGNALLGTSLYVVQRTCRVPLFGGPMLALFLFWGYQLFLVLAASGYVLGVTQSREYAEPEWYVDLWLTLIWVVYLLIYLGTILHRASRTSMSPTGSTLPSLSRWRCSTSSTTWRCRSPSTAPRATRCFRAYRMR